MSESIPKGAIRAMYLHRNSPTLIEIPKVITSPFEVNEIRRHFESNGEFQPVGKQGYSDDSGIGSNRISLFDDHFAQYLNELLWNSLPKELDISERSYVDSGDNYDDKIWSVFTLAGVSPYFRYMKYEDGGEHFPHYDSPYVHSSNTRTLLTGLLYLSTNNTGATTFIHDQKNHGKKIKDRDLRDWTRQATPDEIYHKSYPEAGKVILFEHQMCHAVEKFISDEKDSLPARHIIRFDVYYRNMN